MVALVRCFFLSCIVLCVEAPAVCSSRGVRVCAPACVSTANCHVNVVGPNVCVCVCGAQGAVKDELPQRILHSIWLLGIISDWQPLLRKACNCGCGWGAGQCMAVVRLLGGWVGGWVGG
jgi:hypothetical protein